MKLHFWPVVGSLMIFLNIGNAFANKPADHIYLAPFLLIESRTPLELSADQLKEEYRGTVDISSKVMTLAGAMLPASLAVQSLGSQIDASHPGRTVLQLAATFSIAAISTIPTAYLAGLVPQALLNKKLDGIRTEKRKDK